MRNLLAILILLSGCAMEGQPESDVTADVEPLTTCWNTLVATTTPGWPPLDMFVSAKAMQQWMGGSWKPCTDNANDTKVICKRLVGPQQVTAYWNYTTNVPGEAHMSVFYYDNANETDYTHSLFVWTTDWDDNVFTHATLILSDTYSGGTIDVTHSSGNNWNVHTCLNN